VYSTKLIGFVGGLSYYWVLNIGIQIPEKGLACWLIKLLSRYIM